MPSTITALSTPTGGALAIIRISGPQTIEILSKVFTGNIQNAAPNTIHYGRIFAPSIPSETIEVIDEVLVSIFRAPHSYTGEDSAEISCHGSAYIAQRIIELLIQNGCQQAQPGEFTQRAFLAGKMDLSQAEAVADLIAASNRATHHLALSQLRGDFSSELSRLRTQLLRLTSLLELELDFSDHEDLEFADRSELLTLAQTIHQRISSLAQSFRTGQALKQGIPVAIVGKTNVGKSTILNRLLHDDRAIVSDVHGTTRDTIEDVITINGAPFRIIDTAGLRSTSDTVEQIGIDRTYQAISKAQIIVWVTDTDPSTYETEEMHQRTQGKSLIQVRNKSDLLTSSGLTSRRPLHIEEESKSEGQGGASSPHRGGDDQRAERVLIISAKHDPSLSTLEQAIYSAANLPDISENDIIVTSSRHYEALLHAQQNLDRVLEGMQSGITGDLLAEDLRLVLSDLSEITGGQITPQETLNNIFSHFCIGK